MAKILLLEPGYKNKLPPIGLMKIANYHNHNREDFVWFSKGKLPSEISENVKDKIKNAKYYVDRYCDGIDEYINTADEIIRNGKWDRIYITSLFTFEWKRTIETINYAKTLVDDISKIFVGGISATLMSKEFEQATGIKPHCGLLSDSSQLGYESGVCIDTLIPDYSILEQIEYDYHRSDAYMLTATRGCGNRCSFCAVQRLEPDYQDYIPIIPRIEEIKWLYGEKKNLFLLDNNVLKSSAFNRIIDDIKQAGFAKGDTIINPISRKRNRRYVDFNQGLDAKFLTEEKAKLLGEIALKPAHIGFDNISEKERYLKALRLMDKYDICDISSFLLYNTRKINSKGTICEADTPKQLYERMKINHDFTMETNARRVQEGKKKFDAFAFPMRFVPLNYKDRSFVGDNWTKKLLSGVQAILCPSHGGVYITDDYFNHMYGKTYDEFYRNILMPRQYIENKGKPLHKYPLGKHPNTFLLRCIDEWSELYSSLSDEDRKAFELTISDNHFTNQTYSKIEDDDFKKLYIHYFTGKKLVDFIEKLQPNEIAFVLNYIQYECPSIYWCSQKLLSENSGFESIKLTNLVIGLFENKISA